MKSTPRILVLYEGDPFAGTRGGDVYAQHLFTRLRDRADLLVVNRATLGISSDVTGEQYATALKTYLKDIAWRSPVLLDGSSFYQMTESVRMLRHDGWGPVVSVLQEWLPARERNWRMRLHLTRYMFRFAHAVHAHVAVSSWLKKRLTRLGVSGTNVAVARPGVPVACFESAANVTRGSSRFLRVVSAGVYHPSKGQQLLVEAIGELARRNANAMNEYRVEMYGSMPPDSTGYVQHLRTRIAELGIGAAVTLHEHLPQAELWTKFGAADAFAFMAHGEGLPLVVLESMLHGCVPLVPTGSPMVELLRGDRFGLAVRSTPPAVANALETTRKRLAAHSTWPTEIAREASSTTLRWPDAVSACTGHILSRMGIQ